MSPLLSARKAEILDTALSLAFEGGPGAVTTVAIAERLGLTQPALYRHFRSKAELWEAIARRLEADVAANIAQAEAHPGGALDRLRALVLGQLALVARTPALPEIMVGREASGAEGPVRAMLQARMALFQQLLVGLCGQAQAEGTLRPDRAAADIATLVMGVIQSLALRLLLSRDPAAFAGDGARLLDIQLAALARPCEAP